LNSKRPGPLRYKTPHNHSGIFPVIFVSIADSMLLLSDRHFLLGILFFDAFVYLFTIEIEKENEQRGN
jgi:hypothetical protein